MQFQSVSVCLSSLSPCKRNGFESRKLDRPAFLKGDGAEKTCIFLKTCVPPDKINEDKK